MVDPMQAWLASGDCAVVHNVSLRPLALPRVSTLPVAYTGAQGSSYELADDNRNKWILKKFFSAMEPEAGFVTAVQPLIPRRSGFEAGFERAIVSGAGVSHSPVQNVDLRSWITGTVLMPYIETRSWADVIRLIRDGSRVLSRIEKLILLRRMSEAVGWLESASLAHRDLSSANVLVDIINVNVHLIDWDNIFHPSLNLQSNAVIGSNGYLAPFVRRNGVADVETTWNENADRFALAALNAELLTVNANSRQHPEGGLLDQAEIFNRSGATIVEMKTRLRQMLPAATSLFDAALYANNFRECPGPADWLNVINTELQQTAQEAWSDEEPVEEIDSPYAQPYESHFVEIDRKAFVKIDPAAFVGAPKKR